MKNGRFYQSRFQLSEYRRKRARKLVKVRLFVIRYTPSGLAAVVRETGKERELTLPLSQLENVQNQATGQDIVAIMPEWLAKRNELDFDLA